MIAQLTGTVLKAGATSCVLDVGGVGFLAHVTPSTAAALRPPAQLVQSLTALDRLAGGWGPCAQRRGLYRWRRLRTS